jgi:hypothetical protein
MATLYTLDAFLNRVSLPLFDAYCASRGIALGLAPSDLAGHDDATLHLLRAIGGLPHAQRAQVECDGNDLFTLGGKQGFETLVFVAAHGLLGEPENLADLLEPWPTTQDKALWVLLHRPAIFAAAVERVRVIALATGWRHRNTHPAPTPPSMDAVTCVRLAERIKAHYRAHLLAEQCHVRCYRDGEHTFYCAYPQDYAVKEAQYRGDGTFVYETFRGTFDLLWRYNHVSGRLSIFAPDKRKATIDTFAEMFMETVLACESLSQSSRVFTLDILQSVDDAWLLTRAQEVYREVESVSVKEVTLELNHQSDLRITLATGHESGTRWLPMPELQRRALNYDDRLLSATRIVGAQLHVKFPGKHPRGSVTVRIRTPDYCDLQDKPNDRKVRRVLERWGIDCG